MKNLLTTVCILCGLILSTFRLEAHPYASGVTVTNGTVSYRLNETVSNGMVYVLFDNGSASNFVGTNVVAGLQSFSLGTHSNFTITVFNLGNGVPHQISPNPSASNPQVDFFGPRGVAVNNNLGSPYFGTIYVANAAPGADGVRTVGKGVYALNADFSDAFGYTTNAMPAIGTNAGQVQWGSSTTYGCYHLSVGPDDMVYIGDASGGDSAGTTVGGGVWMAQPNLSSAVDLFPFNGTVSSFGQVCDVGTPRAYGSYSNGTLTLYTLEWNREPYQNVWEYQFFTNVNGTNTPLPLPWNLSDLPIDFPESGGCTPVYPAGLPVDGNGFVNSGISSVNEVLGDLAIDPGGRFYVSEGRSSGQQESLWVFDNATNGNCLLWAGYDQAGGGTAADPFQGSECVAISPDGQYVATGTTTANTQYGGQPGYVLFAPLTATNALGATNLPAIPPSAISYNPGVATTVRGIAFDLADNVYAVSGSEDSLRVFSLGLTTTAVTGNDMTGTNGAFQLFLPPTRASVIATTALGSQNYGSPIPAVFTIVLNTNFLAAPVTINFTISPSTATSSSFVVSATNSITFPAGTAVSGNWSSNIYITPTAFPLSGGTSNVTITLLGGATYLAESPVGATAAIVNTGPDVLSIASTTGSTMYRGVTNDYATFTITRLGDTNGPAPSHSPSTLTVTNFIYGGTAVFGSDYTAGVQPVPVALNNSPVSGSAAVTFNPGDITKTICVGNPVRTPTGSPRVGNETITITLGPTNTLQGVSQEGYPYTIVSNSTVTLTEIDNAYAPEVVLWSDALTNAAASTNWTVTFAPMATPAVVSVIKNYTNGIYGGPSYAIDNGTNDFEVEFGYDVANDGVGASPDMLANGWTTALKTTVNGDPDLFLASGVNVLLQGQTFSGNYAVRFTANLSEGGYNVPQFAIFGMDQYGTNCDWRANPSLASTSYTNHDGIWWAVSTGPGGSVTPADFDMLEGGAASGASSVFEFPNAGDAEPNSDPSSAFAGTFKHPPYTGDPFGSVSAGLPSDGAHNGANTWCDVELRQIQGVDANNTPYITNVMFINHTLILGYTNTGVFTSGTVMLGYEDPGTAQGDTAAGETAAAYYSNLRVVETAPTVIGQPTNLTVNTGSNAAFYATGVGTAPFTNIWYVETSTGPVVLSSNTLSGASNSTSLSLSAVTLTNAGSYYLVVSDVAGSITSRVATLSVVSGPVLTGPLVSVTNSAGSTVLFTVGVAGSPLAYQWSFTAVGSTNATVITNATTGTLTLTNIQPASAGTYSVVVTNTLGTVTSSATLTISAAPPTFANSVVLSNGNVVLKFTSPNAGDTTNSFILQSASDVIGPWTDATSAVFTNAPGGFQVTVPENGSTEFFRLQHQ